MASTARTSRAHIQLRHVAPPCRGCSPSLTAQLLVEEFQKRSSPGEYMNFLRMMSKEWTKESPELYGYRMAVREIESSPHLLKRLFALPARAA